MAFICRQGGDIRLPRPVNSSRPYIPGVGGAAGRVEVVERECWGGCGLCWGEVEGVEHCVGRGAREYRVVGQSGLDRLLTTPGQGSSPAPPVRCSVKKKKERKKWEF